MAERKKPRCGFISGAKMLVVMSVNGSFQVKVEYAKAQVQVQDCHVFDSLHE